MKKLIAILLVGVLLASGLGSVAYALEEPDNGVKLDFHTGWNYNSPGDVFTQSVEPVTGERKWFTAIYESVEPVTGANLSLTSDLPLGWFHPEPETIAPSTYQWSFGDVSWAKVGVGFAGSGPSPVDFFPGFDASRVIVDNKTVFLQSEGTQTQTLNITVTPRDSTKIDLRVQAPENELVNPIITSPTTNELQGIWLSPDGHDLQIYPTGLELDREWSITVTIDVMPKVPRLEYMPFVEVHRGEFLRDGSANSSSSFTYTVPELGTWTWSTTGTYDWQWRDSIVREVHWSSCSREDNLRAHFITSWNYNSPGDSFTNDNVTGSRQWAAKIQNRLYATGETLASANLTLTSDLEFDFIYPEPETMGPSTYEWLFGEVPVGGGKEVHVASESSDVTYTPGFDASRSVDKTVFDAPGTQTLTITVTPREAMDSIAMNVAADYPDWLNAAITSCKLEDGSGGDKFTFNLSPDGYWLWTWLDGPVVNTEYTYIVTIEVTPTVPKVECLPLVQVVNLPKGPITPGGTGGSLTYATVDGMGAWTWSTGGSYPWAIAAGEPFRSVVWHRSCREIVNTPPVAQAGVDPYLAPVGSDFTFDGSASSDEDGTIVSWDWDFGDGNVGTGMTTTHAYEFAGLYNATLTVTDDMGAQSTDSVMAVVYDPAAGFATGGGWFIPGGKTSYDNDYLPNIDGTSPANFGFVVKYKKGASTPDGQLEFQYQQGDFNLHSSGMEWLVITNKNWAKFQGLAIIKGLDGLYPFHVDARDGDFGGRDQPDRFIIKVWAPEANPDSDEPIYKASGDLQGGNIVIHGEGYEVTTLRLQSWYQPDDPLMQPLEDFAEAVNNQSDSVRIELYNDLVLEELADAIKWGDVEMGLMYTGQLRDYSRVMDAGPLPFLYNDDDGLMAALQAGVGDLMSQEMVAHNINVLGWTTTAFSHLLNRQVVEHDQMVLDHPFIHPDDLIFPNGEGLKIRVTRCPIQDEAISEWGGEPITAPMREIYELLEKEYIEGAMHSPYLYDVCKLYEVAPYFCVNYAFASLAGLCINSDVWNSLDAETRQIITEAAGDYVNEMLATVKQMDAEALERIKGYEGVEVYTLTPAERLVWKEASQPVWDRWVQDVGDVGQQIIDIALTQNPLS